MARLDRRDARKQFAAFEPRETAPIPRRKDEHRQQRERHRPAPWAGSRRRPQQSQADDLRRPPLGQRADEPIHVDRFVDRDDEQLHATTSRSSTSPHDSLIAPMSRSKYAMRSARSI